MLPAYMRIVRGRYCSCLAGIHGCMLTYLIPSRSANEGMAEFGPASQTTSLFSVESDWSLDASSANLTDGYVVLAQGFGRVYSILFFLQNRAHK